MTILALLAFNLSANAGTLSTYSDTARESGWDVVASQLAEEIAAAKNEKKLQKLLSEREFDKLTMPVSFFAGSGLVFQSATDMTGCTWNHTVTCRFTTRLTTDQNIPTDTYQALCKTAYATSPVMNSDWETAPDGTLNWSVSKVEACWALGGEKIAVGPVADNGLDGVGQGDDFNPPELVELSWREAEEVLRSKLPIFRYCYQKLPQDHPAKSGRLEVSYHIDENGRIDKAEVERATFTDSALTSCVLERFKRVQIRPPMGGWTGGVFVLSFAK